jgi:5-formyltetrahydrofolate cyclo-ligase
MPSPDGSARRAKQDLRESVWRLLEARGVARFPLPLTDRIPNFVGTEAAAARAARLPEWQAARRLKSNPDAPQRPLRLQALRDGKVLFMAVPRLRTARCFLRLDPHELGPRVAEAATIAGAGRRGRPVGPDELPRLDLVIVGSVAVNERGARVGKGGGYSDLEFALARTVGAVDDHTPVLTTVHELQVVDGEIPMTAHDVPVDLIVTPERVIRPPRVYPRPRALLWEELSEEQLRALPAVARLRMDTA